MRKATLPSLHCNQVGSCDYILAKTTWTEEIYPLTGFLLLFLCLLNGRYEILRRAPGLHRGMKVGGSRLSPSCLTLWGREACILNPHLIVPSVRQPPMCQTAKCWDCLLQKLGLLNLTSIDRITAPMFHRSSTRYYLYI